MKKIRINELARELEVKAHEILDRLPELGVTEKKTHSSSIDEDVAIKLRRLYGFDVPDAEPDYGGTAVAVEEEPFEEAQHDEEPPVEGPSVPAVKPEAPKGPAPATAEAKPEPEAERPVENHTPHASPIRPPLAGRPIHPPIGGMPRPEGPRAPAAPASPAGPAAPAPSVLPPAARPSSP